MSERESARNIFFNLTMATKDLSYCLHTQAITELYIHCNRNRDVVFEQIQSGRIYRIICIVLCMAYALKTGERNDRAVKVVQMLRERVQKRSGAKYIKVFNLTNRILVLC